MLNVKRLDTGKVTILRLSGDIDEYGIDMLRTQLMGCIREQRCHIVVNMCGVKFVSYMGVGVLVERLRQCRSNHGDMKLVGINLYTERLFRMVGVTKVFEVFESEGQALSAYQQAA